MGGPWLPIEPWHVIEARLKEHTRLEELQRETRREELIRQLQQFAADIGRAPLPVELDSYEHVASLQDYLRVFGSETAWLEAAGIQPIFEPSGRQNDIVLLERLWHYMYLLGRDPSSSELTHSHAPDWLVNGRAYRDRFGSVSQAKMKAWQLIGTRNAFALANSPIVRVGLVGYCPPSRFDTAAAERLVRDACNRVAREFASRPIVLVSGLSDVGVLAIGYREAVARGWKTAGVASLKALNYQQFPVDEKLIIGRNWGDESAAFVNSLHAIVRVGGGEQSLAEVAQLRETGNPVFEYELPLLS